MFNRKIGTISWKIHRPYEGMAIGGGTPTYTKEVTGNGYIDLTDAVVNKLLELKAYGGCVQASTPTPTTPVDIVCNNGTLKIKDKELPVGYVRLESIELDAGPYYNTNEKLYGSDVVSMTISQNGSSGRNIFGAYTSTTSDVNFSFYGYPTASGQAYLRYGASLYRPIIGTGTRSITFGSGGTTGFATNSTIPEQTFETEDVAYIGALPNSSSSRFDGTFYGNIEISNSGTTRLKWIPCKRKSDGVIGYYEVVNGNFLEPSGSGTPTAGAEDYSNIEIYVEGTKEKIGITTTYDTIDGNGTYVSPNSARTTRAYKTFGKLPAGTYKLSISGGYELIIQYRDTETGTSTQYGNIGTWTTEGTLEADGTMYYGIAIRIPPNGSTAITSFTGTISFTEYQNTATCEDLLGVGDYKDEQEILSGNVITNVGVAVLDGTEGWASYQSGACWAASSYLKDKVSGNSLSFSTHYGWSSSSPDRMQNNQFLLHGTQRLCIKDDRFGTYTDFIQFLKDQYNAGTPVIIVYPLATPTTLSVAGQSLSIPAGNSRIEIVEGSILNLPLYAKYKSTSE